MPDEIDSFFSASPQNLQFENTMTKVYDVIHTLISQTRVKEKKMFDKIAELKTDMEKETKILFPNLTMDGL